MYKFIFIDDEDMARDFFEKLLPFNEYGFELAGMYSTAEEALAYLRDTPDISAVITDINMGNMSGIDLCELVREINDDIQLICLTGYKEFEYAQRAIKCRVFDYLLKPMLYEDIEGLFQRLKKHLDENAGEDIREMAGSSNGHYTSIIDMIKQYIEERYSHEITLESVASYVSMNSTYLSRFFKQHTGCNFIDYLTSFRMEKAMALLQDPTVRIGEVCNMVGYKTPQHFVKLFKQYTGCTPSEFRTNVLSKA